MVKHWLRLSVLLQCISSYHLSYITLPDFPTADGYRLLYNAIKVASLAWLHAYTANNNVPAQNRVWPHETYKLAMKLKCVLIL